MPIPKVRKGESDAQFISRCISNSTMKKEYPNQQQRVAVCNDSLKKTKGENMKIKKDEKGRKIIAENVNIIFTGEIEENVEE